MTGKRINMLECGESYVICHLSETETGNVRWTIHLHPDKNTNIGRLLKVVNIWLHEQGAVASVTKTMMTNPTLTAWQWGKY
jgi:hypothetical protein